MAQNGAGAYFTNHLVRSHSPESVLAAAEPILRSLGCVSLSYNGWVALYSDISEKMPANPYGQRMAASLDAGLFTFTVTGNTLSITLYDGGLLISSFETNSSESEESGTSQITASAAMNARKKEAELVMAAGRIARHCPGVTAADIAEALRAGGPAALPPLAQALGIPESLITTGYRYVRKCGIEGIDADSLVPLSDAILDRTYIDVSFAEAAAESDLASMRLFIARGAQVDRPHNRAGETLLAQAVKNRRVEVVALLLELGADPNKPAAGAEPGATPLIVAAGHTGIRDDRPEQIIRLLLAAGANPAARTISGNTALTSAQSLADASEYRRRRKGPVTTRECDQAAERSAERIRILRRGRA